MVKFKRTPHKPLNSTNPRDMAAEGVAMAKSVPRICPTQPMRARHLPTYSTQDQKDEVSWLRTSAAAAAKPTKPGNDSKDDDDDNDNDKEKGQENGKKGGGQQL
jgi:hypothetical protein